MTVTEKALYTSLSVNKSLDINISLIRENEELELSGSVNDSIEESVNQLFEVDAQLEELKSLRNAFVAMTKKIDEALTKYNAIASLYTTLECIDMIIDDSWPTLNELEEIPAYAGRFGYHTGAFAELDGDVVWRVDNGLVKIDITEGEFNMLKWY